MSAKKRKILIIAETVMDGVGKHVVDLIDHLDKDRFECHVIHGTKRLDYRFQKVMDTWQGEVFFYPVDILVRNINLKNDILAYRHIRKLVKMIEPDVVHCHSSKAGVLGRLAAKLGRVKTILYTPHAYAMQAMPTLKAKKLLYWGIELFFARIATTYTINVSCGERDYALAHKLAHSSKHVVIYNALTSDKEPQGKKPFDPPSGKAVIGCVSRMFVQKDPFFFLEVARACVLRREDVHFVWVGDGELMQECRQFVADKGIGDHVSLVGYREDIDAWLSVFDVFLSTAAYEGLPYTLVEALRAGLPIVATNVVGNNEVVIHGENGFLFARGDVSDCIGYLDRLIDDEEEAKAISLANQKRFSAFFHIDGMIETIEKLYE